MSSVRGLLTLELLRDGDGGGGEEFPPELGVQQITPETGGGGGGSGGGGAREGTGRFRGLGKNNIDCVEKCLNKNEKIR